MGGMATADALHLVLGDEELLVMRGIAAAVAKARAVDAEATVEEYAAGDMTVGDVMGAVSPSLFGALRVVVIRDAQDAKKDVAAAITEYVQQPEPEVVLVVAHAGGAKGKALADAVRAAGAVVTNAARVTRHRERVEFVREEFRRLGGKASDDAAEALLAAVGNDLRELAAACSQLVADTSGRIDRATVSRYYRGRAEVSGFTVADATIAGNLPGALEALRWALHVGIDPVVIADALADGIRTVARVAAAGRGNPYQLANSLGLQPWKVERAQKQARGWTPESLARATRIAAECNAAVKGGMEDRDYAVEQAVIALVAARSATPAAAGRSGARS